MIYKFKNKKEWHEWFAWYPVITYENEFVWLERVERKDVCAFWRYRLKGD